MSEVTLTLGKPEKFFSFPLFLTPKVFTQLKALWNEILADMAFRKEILRLVREMKKLSMPILNASTLPELEHYTEIGLNNYMLLKYQISNLIETEFLESTPVKENFWNEFLALYEQGCYEMQSFFRSVSSKFFPENKSELLLSA